MRRRLRERSEGRRLSTAPRAIQGVRVSRRSAAFRPLRERERGGGSRRRAPACGACEPEREALRSERCRNGAIVRADASSAGAPSPSPLPSRTGGRRLEQLCVRALRSQAVGLSSAQSVGMPSRFAPRFAIEPLRGFPPQDLLRVFRGQASRERGSGRWKHMHRRRKGV